MSYDCLLLVVGKPREPVKDTMLGSCVSLLQSLDTFLCCQSGLVVWRGPSVCNAALQIRGGHCGVCSPYLVCDVREAPSSSLHHITTHPLITSSGKVTKGWYKTIFTMTPCTCIAAIPGMPFYQGSNENPVSFFLLSHPFLIYRLTLCFPFIASYTFHSLPRLREVHIFQVLSILFEEGA